jgi:hypothetical protein
MFHLPSDDLGSSFRLKPLLNGEPDTATEHMARPQQEGQI